MKHKFADLIKRKAGDMTLVVEYKTITDRWNKWVYNNLPDFDENFEWRIRHKHQDLIDQKAARPELIVKCKDIYGAWRTTYNLYGWDEDTEYRLVEPPKPRHKHQDLIDAKTARPELLVQTVYGEEWSFCDLPAWFEDSEYRLVEPKPKRNHQHLIDAKAARPELIVEYHDTFGSGEWTFTDKPKWYEEVEYRLVEPPKPRHKHQDLIDQKAARPELIVEYYSHIMDKWNVVGDEEPSWLEELKYRLVEPVQETVEMWQWVVHYDDSRPFTTASYYSTEKELAEEMWAFKIIQRADWTRIEVPV